MTKHRNEDSLDEGSLHADDFKQQSRSRVWMRDAMRYPVQRNYNQDLYSFAWAQAVQNKPLGLDVRPEEDEIEYEIDDGDDEIVGEDIGGVECEIEKEEGEIEEGEIELGYESVNLEPGNLESVEGENEEKEIEKDLDLEEKEEEIGEFDKQFGDILEELETITIEEAESSFEEVCSRLQKCFASLKHMYSEGHGPVLDVLSQQAFMGIQTVYSAFNSGNLKKNHQNEERLLRFLVHIKNQYSACLTPEQVKELDVKLQELASESVSTGKTTERPVIVAEKPMSNAGGGQFLGNNIEKPTLGKLEVPTPRARVDFSPLLNLHADYDEDSLPSPTRNNAPPLPMMKPPGFGKGEIPFAQPIAPKNLQAENGTSHHYVTDAFKAVSSYQQKYGKNSVLTSTRLPSPTPSEDGNGGDDDVISEVSSLSVAGNVGASGPCTAPPMTSVNCSAGYQMSHAYTSGGLQMPPVNSSGGFQMAPAYCSAGPLEPNPIVKASVKSRDPRLRFMNSEIDGAPQSGFTAAGPLHSRKHKVVEEPLPVEDNLKRQRMMAANNGTVATQQNSGVQLNCREVGSERSFDANHNINGLHGSSLPNSFSGPAPVVSLPSLFKDIAVNPMMLMNLLKMEQQKRAAGEAQQNAAGAVSSSSDVGKNPTSKPQMSPQTVSMNAQNDIGKIRMKPRDPRRVLHSNIETSSSEPVKTSGSLSSDAQSSKDHSPVREQGEQSQTTSSYPIPSKISSNPTEPKTVHGVCSQRETASTSKSANPWGDVDHLLDGYDDQQKAAIQKERARRIEEQNKMFATRRLCLVLDLDHTLLNSAKFVEVDPVHEEILRKKEEQDRQMPERHLFRFPHMGMWTKLRPGIWRFLEKASKLYELHLYTMGNKLYATEMAKVLDPKGTLFSGRVISKGDDDDSIDGDERVPKSKDLDGVLGMESAVVIIDDSLRVWPHNKHNLIVVERYTYFPSSRRQFGLAGPSLLEIDHDERPEAGTLASSLAVIERLHQIFFSHHSLNEVDIRNILASEQRKILAGCKIVFSRVFPVGEANPHLHPLWQTAEQFGAECTNQIDEKVTHVVANSRGTDKVNWALSTGRFVVYPGWVEASALLYRRASEHDFAVKA